MQSSLTEANQRLLQTIYDHFHEYATWPTYRDLEIMFRKEWPLHEIVSKIDRQLVRVEDVYRGEMEFESGGH